MTTGTPLTGVLTLARMARRLGVTQAWLRTEADTGRLPCLCAGARYLFAAAGEAVLAERAGAERQEVPHD